MKTPDVIADALQKVYEYGKSVSNKDIDKLEAGEVIAQAMYTEHNHSRLPVYSELIQISLPTKRNNPKSIDTFASITDRGRELYDQMLLIIGEYPDIRDYGSDFKRWRDDCDQIDRAIKDWDMSLSNTDHAALVCYIATLMSSND